MKLLLIKRSIKIDSPPMGVYYPHVAGEQTICASAMMIFCTFFFYFHILLTHILYLLSLICCFIKMYFNVKINKEYYYYKQSTKLEYF